MRTTAALALLSLVLSGGVTAEGNSASGQTLAVTEDGNVRASFHDADLRDVLRAFARVGKFQLVLDESVRGRVNAELDGVPLAAALRAILRSHGLAAEVDGRIWPEGDLADDAAVIRVYGNRR